jgi:UDP-N-acetylmuramoylalanine--D-glutamate ligase
MPDHMQSFERFRGKRGLVMGLGLFGGGVEAARFLAGYCSRVLVTDLRDASVLADSVEALRGLPVEFRLGEHREQDFREADVVIHSPAVRPDHKLLQLARDAGAEVTMEMSLFIEACPATTIGITGSNGKTTTTALCYEMLCEVFERAQPDLAGEWAGPVASLPPVGDPRERVWLGGNIGQPLLTRVAEMTPFDVVVLELSSFQLSDWRRIKRSCNVGVITNITPNHLDWHRDFDEYRDAKTAVFEYWSEWGDPPLALVNADDPECASIAARNPGRFRLVSTREPLIAELFQPGRRQPFASGAGGNLQVQGLVGRDLLTRDRFALPGDFNWANAVMAASAAATVLNPEQTDAIARGAARFRGVEHRLELCGTLRGARVYNDSIATDPAATIAALQAFPGPLRLIMGGGSKNIDYGALGRTMATHGNVQGVYLQGATGPAIRHALHEAGIDPSVIHECDGFEAACNAAFRASHEGEVLLMSPASTSFYEYAPGKRFTNFEDRGRIFKALVQAHSNARPS